ncbi:MAG: ATP-binding protein [Planctomycetes bacterium]|nr:ATP-binding protein [Planctomycetota bacterium]
MPVPFRLDLRWRIVLLVMLAAVPALLLALAAGLRARAVEAERAGNESLRIARLSAITHRQLIESTRHLLETVALVPEVRARDAPACRDLLVSLSSRFPSYALLLLVDADGRSFACSQPGAVIDVSDRPYFARVAAGGGFSVGEYAVGRISGKPSLHCAVPVLDAAGTLGAVAVAAIDLGWVGQVASTAELPPGSVVTVLDRQSVILARTVLSERLVGTKAPDEAIRQLALGPEGIFRLVGPDAVDRIYGHSALRDPDGQMIGSVIVGVPVEQAYARAQRGLLFDLALVVVVAVVAVLAARLMARRLIERPVQELVAVTGRLASGDLAARTRGLGGADEFATLARAIDTLAAALALREAGSRADAEEIRRAHTLLRTLVDATPLAVFLLDLQGRVTSLWSRGAEAMLGWREVEVLGSPPPHVPEEHRAEFVEHYRRVTSGEVLAGIEVERMRKDGRRLRVALYAAPVAGPDGRTAGTITMLADVTAQRLLQEQLQQSQKIEVVGRLVGGVAHDFNNLLAVISGHSDLLLKRVQDPAHRQQVEQIQGAAQRAAALTGRLLGFARRQGAKPRQIDLALHLDDSMRLLTAVVGDRVTLSAHREGPCPVVADPVQIDQVLMNLAINARDALPQGGEIGVSVAVNGGRVELAVSDNGMGMDAAVQARLFEPFFTTKPPGKGTGLGLATVNGIVQELGGTIAVRSAPGAGSTFTVALPLAGNGDRPRHRSPRPLPGTVLAVDDDPAVLAVVAAALGELGCRVATATDATEALARIEAGLVPDLLVTDLVMPGMDGASLARAARARLPGLRVLVVSGYAEDRLTRAAAELGAGTAVLGKPFSAHRLAETVRAVMA